MSFKRYIYMKIIFLKKRCISLFFLVPSLYSMELADVSGVLFINHQQIEINKGILFVQEANKNKTMSIILQKVDTTSLCQITAELPKEYKFDKKIILQLNYNTMSIVCVHDRKLIRVLPLVKKVDRDIKGKKYSHKQVKLHKMRNAQGSFFQISLKPFDDKKNTRVVLRFNGKSKEDQILRLKKIILPVKVIDKE